MPKIKNKTRTIKAIKQENRLLKDQVKALEQRHDEDHEETLAWSDRYYEEHAQVSILGGKLQDALSELSDLNRKNKVYAAALDRRNF